MTQYYTLNPEILKLEGLSLLEKNLLCIFKGYQDHELYCFETQKELAKLFNVSNRYIEVAIKNLKNKNLIFLVKKSKIQGHQFKNRKAIIMVDKNNPLPKTEEEMIKLNDIKEVKERQRANKPTQEKVEMKPTIKTEKKITIKLPKYQLKNICEELYLSYQQTQYINKKIESEEITTKEEILSLC